MEGINGQSAAEGIAIGKILVYKNQQISVDEHKVDDPDKEFERFITARDKSVNELVKLKELADSKTGKESAQNFYHAENAVKQKIYYSFRIARAGDLSGNVYISYYLYRGFELYRLGGNRRKRICRA